MSPRPRGRGLFAFLALALRKKDMPEIILTSAVREFRDANETRVAQANGAALATSVIAISTQPLFWSLLAIPCGLFALGLTVSVTFPLFRMIQSWIQSASIKEGKPLQDARDSLSRTGSTEAAIAVLLEGGKTRSRSLVIRTLCFLFYSLEFLMTYYVIICAVIFIVGISVGFIGAWRYGIPTEHGAMPSPKLS
jgi:hypothetical protein